MAETTSKPPDAAQKPTSDFKITPFRMVVAVFLFGIVYCQYTMQLDPLHHTDYMFASKHEFLKPGQLDHGKVVFQTLSDAPVLSRPLPRYFMAFSTSCTDQQNWESYLFFFHAFKAQQKGTITRITAGCTEDKKKKLEIFHKKYIATLNPNFKLHFTPDFSRETPPEDEPLKYAYKYMNKPFGLKHWMENALGIYANGTNPKGALNWIIMLMDPDMLLLRPLMHNFTDIENHLWVEKKPATRIVSHGNPIAQQDGYLTNAWMKLDLAYITGKPKGQYVDIPKRQDGPIHWNSGPPYLATAKDMRNIVNKWVEYAPRVHHVYPELFAEMFGFVIATHQLKLPHTLIKSIVVSTTGASDREGWKYVDALPPEQLCDPPHQARLPIGLHYCKRYRLGRNFFSKYRIKKNIMSCDKPLLKPAEGDLLEKGTDWFITPPAANGKDPSQGNRTKLPERPHREFFMLCGLIKGLNEALRFYKQRACVNEGVDANLNETYTIYDDPSNY